MQMRFLKNMARFLSVLCAFVFSSAGADIFLTCNYGSVDESDAADPTLYTGTRIHMMVSAAGGSCVVIYVDHSL